MLIDRERDCAHPPIEHLSDFASCSIVQTPKAGRDYEAGRYISELRAAFRPIQEVRRILTNNGASE